MITIHQLRGAHLLVKNHQDQSARYHRFFLQQVELPRFLTALRHLAQFICFNSFEARSLLEAVLYIFEKPRDYATPATMPLLLGPDGWHSSGS